MFLIINTIEDKSQVVLADSERILAQKSFKAHVEHSEKLLPEIGKLLKTGKEKVAAGFSLRNLKAIVVITGPGSFTGCRVGVATANALSFTLDIPVVGISKDKIVSIGVAHFSAREFIKEILKIAQGKLKMESRRKASLAGRKPGTKKFAAPFYAHPPHITKAKSIF